MVSGGMAGGRKAKVQAKVCTAGAETLRERRGDCGRKRGEGSGERGEGERGEAAGVRRRRGSEAGRAKERDRPGKGSQTLAPPVVCCVGRDLPLKDTEKGRWMVENGEQRARQGGHWPSRTRGRCARPDAPARRPAAPSAPPPGRGHEIGCSRNESARRGGG